VLFACVQNAGRSQMAAAFFNHLADPLQARAISAGTAPADRVHPEAIAAMHDVDIDVSHGVPHQLTSDLAAQAQWVITMGCGDECPVVPGAHREDWDLEDPKGKSAAAVAQIRDDIRARVEAFLARHGWASPLSQA
jgi:arsenate reductase